MRIRLSCVLLFAGFALFGCGGDVQGACREAEAAFVSCQNEHIASSGDGDLIEPDYEMCDGYVGRSDEDLYDHYNCLAAARWWADCSTLEGMQEGSAKASACR